MGAQAAQFVDSGNEWATPWSVVQDAMRHLGISEFDLDPAATAENAKASRFYTREQNGLLQPWFGMTWLNPPFSRSRPSLLQHGAVDFARKAVQELQARRVEAIAWHGPVATDTKWYNMLWPWTHHRTDYFGRIRYNGGKSGGTFPSQTLILRPYPRTVEACPTVLKPFDNQAPGCPIGDNPMGSALHRCDSRCATFAKQGGGQR